MYELYSWLALVLSIGCLSVALALTFLKSTKLVDISFTVREWMFALIFLMTFIVTQGDEDVSYDIFHGQIAQFRVVFMVVVVITSLVSLATLLYTFINRRR